MNALEVGNPTPESLGPAPQDGNTVRTDSVLNDLKSGTKFTGGFVVMALILVGVATLGFLSVGSAGVARNTAPADWSAPGIR